MHYNFDFHTYNKDYQVSKHQWQFSNLTGTFSIRNDKNVLHNTPEINYVQWSWNVSKRFLSTMEFCAVRNKGNKWRWGNDAGQDY